MSIERPETLNEWLLHQTTVVEGYSPDQTDTELIALAAAVIKYREYNKCGCGRCSLCEIGATLASAVGMRP